MHNTHAACLRLLFYSLNTALQKHSAHVKIRKEGEALCLALSACLSSQPVLPQEAQWKEK